MEWSLAGAVILSGLVIVFLILVTLIGVVSLTGRLSGTPSKPKPKSPSPSPSGIIPIVQNASTPAPAPVVEGGISGETVAVISAAVAAMMDEQAPGVAYQVSGIQRARTARPVWGFAGMQQNTRPF